ncbi:hypothetical protein [Acinetobacter indicus]|uniref:hypothetical protein n=1 Tax=Acinetobacter indicus TaxID=756892 RepID=UPI000CEBC511|nr:hypothetical protein [Acinetobacter indicus]
MNDFFLADNRSIRLGDIEVHQIQVKNYDQWLGCTAQIKVFLDKKDHSDEVLTQLFLAHPVDVFKMCLLVTSIDAAQLKKLAADQPEFIQLLRTVVSVNSAGLKMESKPKGKADPDASWFDSFQFLISLGHRHEDIMNMSYGAFQAYLKAGRKNYMNNVSLSATAVRAAQHSDKKGFDKFRKELNKQ